MSDHPGISLPSLFGAIGGSLGLLELAIKWRVTTGQTLLSPLLFVTFIVVATLGFVGAIIYKWQQKIAGLVLLAGSIIPPATWLYGLYYVLATGGSRWGFLFPLGFVDVYWWDGFILIAGIVAIWRISHPPIAL